MNDRITADPNVCGGEPCIRGTRVQVHVVLGHLAARDSEADILANFSSITHEDIEACLEYASNTAAAS